MSLLYAASKVYVFFDDPTMAVVWFLAGGVVAHVATRAWHAGAARREARSMRARAAAVAAEEEAPEGGEGEAVVRCEGGRAFPVAGGDTALVIIDMQHDFVAKTGRVGMHYGGAEPLKGAVAPVARLLAAARRAGLVVAHSRSHRYGTAVRLDLVPRGREACDAGYDVIPELAPLPGEIVTDKWTFGAFASTDLERQLRARGVKRILLCGILTNVCVMATAVQAVDRFFRVCLVGDACAAFKPEWHDAAVDLITQPQRAPGHAKACGLYFGELATVAGVEEALAKCVS